MRQAGDLPPGVRRVGGEPVNMGAQMRDAIGRRPRQRGGRAALEILRGPVLAILVHGTNGGQQTGFRRTAAFKGIGLIQMGVGFDKAGQRQRSAEIP